MNKEQVSEHDPSCHTVDEVDREHISNRESA